MLLTGTGICEAQVPESEEDGLSGQDARRAKEERFKCLACKRAHVAAKPQKPSNKVRAAAAVSVSVSVSVSPEPDVPEPVRPLPSSSARLARGLCASLHPLSLSLD
jgi:hypothetical protein